jgi:putative endonuclease
MPYYTYILESQSTGKLYIGQTNNLSDRLERHNSGRNKYTKGKGPWILLYSVTFETRAEAVTLEGQLKSWKSPARVKA